ncbi:MAG: hypothetical protein Q8936_14595 [Bacillota bacterium]|nr:hypothetical protein [Bacillota bacterium]
MYDAKEKENDKESLRCQCIADRGYFKKMPDGNLLTVKSSQIPVENVLK